MPPKLKILCIITKSNWGGAQRYVYDLATCLPLGEFEVLVACGPSTGSAGSPQASSGQAGPLVEKLKHAGIRVITVPALERETAIGRELAALASLARIIRRERPDIVHLSSSKAGGLGAVAAFLCKILFPIRYPLSPRIIFTVHGWPFREDRPAWQRALIFFFSWLSTVFADRLIVINAADYREARRFVPESKLVLIPHGLPPVDFLSAAEARAFLAGKIGTGAPGDAGIIMGVIAELTRNKGLNYLIDAVNQVKLEVKSLKFKVIVIGEGEEREALQRRIDDLGLGDTIFLIGFLPDAARYLKGLDVCILPSVKEGLPYAVMEAMASGLPVIASAVGGIPDLIQPEKTGILAPPADPAALARAISGLIRSPAERERLGRAARIRITEHFRIGEMVEKTIAVYHSRHPRP